MSEEFECEVCGRTFDTKRGMKVHASQVHKDGGSDKFSGIEFDIGLWKIISGILAVVLIITLVFAYGGLAADEMEGESIPKEEAAEKTLNFLNEFMLQEGMPNLEVEEVNEKYGLYEIVVEVEGMMGPQEHSIYISKDGNVIFPEAVDIDEFEEVAQEQTGEGDDQTDDQDNTETQTGYAIVSEGIDELITCLSEEGVMFYGSDWCPYCTELVEEFGGYETVDPIYVECTEEQERCEEEMVGTGVPEIQINREVYSGERSQEAIAQEVGC